MPLAARTKWAGAAAPVIVVIVLVGWMARAHSRQSATHPTRTAATRPAPPPPPQTTIESTTVPARSVFAKALSPFHLDAGLIAEWVRVAHPVFNLGRIQAGHEVELVRDLAGVPQALRYQIDNNHWLWLRLQTVQAAGQPTAPTAPQWSAHIEAIPYVTKLAKVSGGVQSSLFEAVEDSGEHDALAIDLADIFGWDLDFYTDTRPGDVFRVLVEKKYLDGKFAGYGQIVAAEYVNGGTAYDALRFHDDLGLLAYYRPDGKPLKREFLRSPLKFAARITSGFSYHRYHPILKIYRPHLGIDFAAPIGTPVQTIGSGVVVAAGRKGEDGNRVQIRHAGGYQTLYLHLSRILVRVGEHVAQGQRIGLVGMTGLATGPHLDFRIEHNGQFENFEALRKKLPPSSPVSADQMAKFEALRAHYMPELEALQPVHAVAAATTPAGPH
ncbi:MAG: peptidoglycan DD-metalloendopeptidase family protein [Terriglobales bacterium]